MAFLIDTDLLVDVERGVAAAELDDVLDDQRCAISVITVSELLHGVHRASDARRRTRRRAFVEHVLQGMSAIPITTPVARVHAEVWAELTERGDTPGAHDLWIGSTAIAHGLDVLTRNLGDFGRMPGVRAIALSS